MAGTFNVLLFTTLLATWGIVNSDQCVDKVSCSLYDSSICTDTQYYAWATQNCAQTCNLCKGAASVGSGKIMVAPGPKCTDKLTNCADFGSKMCKDVKFYSWTNENCRAFCKRCTVPCTDTVDNCAAYGDTLCTNLSYYNWVEMHCRKYCARCTS